VGKKTNHWAKNKQTSGQKKKPMGKKTTNGQKNKPVDRENKLVGKKKPVDRKTNQWIEKTN